MTDVELASRAQNGDRDAADQLIRRYQHDATRGWAHGYYLPGGDLDDLQQEALVGLLKAVRDYRTDSGATFASFAQMCVRRQLVTALKTATRVKHRLLTDTARTAVGDDGDECAIVDLIPSGDADAQTRLELRDEMRRISRDLRVNLSATEARCLILFANGGSYSDVQRLTGLSSIKAVDRALTVARWKLARSGPPSDPTRGMAPRRRVYVCPSCGHETVRVTARGHERRGPGRPPACNVCQTRAAAA